MAKKERADQMLFAQGLSESREQAKRMIMAGQAHYLKDGQKLPVTKPGMQLDPDLEIVVKGRDRFVSRGGYKLLTAIEELGLDPKDKIAWMLVLLQGGSQTACYSLVQSGSMRRMSGMDNCIGNCSRTKGLSIWKESTCATQGKT